MKKSPDPLSSSEMREQLRRFAEVNSNLQAYSVRYDHGMPHAEADQQVNQEEHHSRPIHLDLVDMSTPSDWQCSRCAAMLKGENLKVYNSRFVFNGRDLAACPHCGGAARNLHQESIRLASEIDRQMATRKLNLRNGFICGASLALFLVSPSTWTYLLCWIVAFWFGPLADIHLKMKLGAVFIILWAGFFASFVIAALEMSYPVKLMVWLLVTAVMLGAGWVVEKVAALGGGLFYRG